MAAVLGIGVATLDIINELDGYPSEDSEVRAVNQRLSCGGNAVNTLAVLRLLEHRCGFAGMLSDDRNSEFIRRELGHRGIAIDACSVCEGGKTPTSYICLNLRNGSRTIVHYRDLPEYRYEDFSSLDLTGFDWLHFEGRHVEDTRAMLQRISCERPDMPISVEIEKPRAGIETLFEWPGLLIFSHAYIKAKGHVDPASFLLEVSKTTPDSDLVCTLGSAGALAIGRDGEEYFSPAFSPRKVVDTRGAGDVFNAGLVDARLRGMDLRQALVAATRLAGRKCGFTGFDGLKA